jgi:hypothetical protein
MARVRLARKAPARRPSRGRLVAGVLVVLTALVAAFVPAEPALVERVFSRGVYPVVQPGVTSLSSLAPFALLDAWLLLGVALLGRAGWRIARARGSRLTALGGAAWRGLVLAAVVYLVFLASWGLHYRRQPLTSRVQFSAGRVTPEAADALAVRAIGALNAQHAAAHAEIAASPSMSALRAQLAPAFTRAQRALGHSSIATPGRPKTSLLSPYFRWASIDGLINPLGLEVIVSPDVLDVERPFVVAHEWGHLAGWAHESEAGYVAWVTCLGGSRAAQYSGWLSIYWHLRRELPRQRLEVLERTLAAGPREDLRGIAARLARGQPAIQRASWQTYDQYLKANRVPSGVANYDEVLQLVLGVEMDSEGRPRLR